MRRPFRPIARALRSSDAKRGQALLLGVLASVVPSLAADAAAVHYDLSVDLVPERSELRVDATVSLPATLASREAVPFVLHAGLDPQAITSGVRVVADVDPPSAAAFGSETPFPDDVPLESYRLEATGPGGLPERIALRYGGAIDHPLEENVEEYARAFRETPGTISEEGAYLAASTYWYPWLGPGLVTYRLEARAPEGWRVVSQGAPVAPRAGGVDAWEASAPTEDVHVVAAPFVVYEDRAGVVRTYAFLRSTDDALAAKYLETTARYLEMYRRLIGPYPYAKFALVENFWETGYGMPSFTLLGPRIIRFPFILHSSYPHEILHNWWGNGVFVDWELGNWCEGLTAYLADHLIKEQRGEGTAYRRDLLQKYTDFVRGARDFPLVEFRSRHSGATQAVGYGKTAMVFHMLRSRLGDRAFVRALADFYEEHRFERAMFDDLRIAFERASGEGLEAFFDQWIERVGAPELAVASADVVELDDGRYAVELSIEQRQKGSAYALDVPVAVTLEGRDTAEVFVAALRGARTTVRSDAFDARPVGARVDPDFDVFRRLDRREIPAALSLAFGAERATIVLPAAAPEPLAEAYGELAGAWTRGASGDVEVTTDAALERLPSDRAVWVVGWENRFRAEAAAAIGTYGAVLDASGLAVDGERARRDDRSAVAVGPHPASADLALAFVATERPEAVPGLARKLPHYGKYGYLAFSGDEPTNVMKGQWRAVGSPLVVRFGPGDHEPAETPGRSALAELPPAFSKKAMRAHATFLASDALEGRGCGSEGLARAVDYVEAAFREAGLEPGAEDGTYRQTFEAACGEDGREAELANVVGVIPGTDPARASESVVVVAHVDHLGLGWPDVREGDLGKIHSGADDNASGVAVLLELATRLAPSLAPKRPVVFLVTTGEEAGLLGARHWVSSSTRFPVSKTIGAINLDTVGRLGDRELLVLGVASATEWVHIARGSGFVTGVANRPVSDDLGASDHAAFLEVGVPAVQLFSGPHLDYHRPTDTVDRLDLDGMIEVAAFTREFVAYLADREAPMTVTLEGVRDGGATTAAPRDRGGRTVKLGSIPDFAWEGEGCRLEGVVPGSPAEAAGLREGDVLLRVGVVAIEGLRDLARALEGKVPGDRVTVVYLRDGQRASVEVELEAR